jgi:hypothetical protein
MWDAALRFKTIKQMNTQSHWLSKNVNKSIANEIVYLFVS